VSTTPSTEHSYVVDAADYWELRARQRDVQAVELELLQQRLEGQQRLVAAQRASETCLRALLTKYAIPAGAGLRWDDATRSITVTPATPAPPPGDAP
jgi:hypothetical protein